MDKLDENSPLKIVYYGKLIIKNLSCQMF